MISPFKKGSPDSVDFEAVEKITEHLINNASDGIIVSGTTGESPTLTHDEEIEIFTTVQAKLKQKKSKTKLIFGAGSNSTQTAITMAKKAEKLNADALLIVTPYYNKPNQKGLFAHYSAIARASNLPIILYNVPSRTNISLQAKTIIELNKEYKHICALKEASTNFDIITQIRLELACGDFKIYSGDDSSTLAMLSLGADGVISVASHFVGKEMKDLVTKFKQGQHSEALKIHQKLFPLFCGLFVETNPICAKSAMEYLGLASKTLREPLVNLTEAQEQELFFIIAKTVKLTA